jgi:hypothetical protein
MPNRRVRIGAACAVLAVVGTLLSGCADDSAAGNPAASAASGSPVGTAPPDAATGTPHQSSGHPDYTLIDPSSEHNVLSAGRYALAPIGPYTRPLAVVDVPDGFLNSGPFLFPVGEGAHAEHAPVSRAIGYWTVTGVYKDPCAKKAGPANPGPRVDDLARALATQRRSKTTDPIPVSLDGHDGVYMELTAPRRLDFRTCRLQTFDYWASDPVGGAYTDTPDMVTRLWILDVNGDRVVLAVAVAPGVGRADTREVTDIAESANFVDK